MRTLALLRLALAGLAPALTACWQDMSDQPRYDPYDRAALFADDEVLQEPPVGTVARDDPEWTKPYRERPPLTAALLERGRERYGIYCSPCPSPA